MEGRIRIFRIRIRIFLTLNYKFESERNFPTIGNWELEGIKEKEFFCVHIRKKDFLT